MQSKIPFAI